MRLRAIAHSAPLPSDLDAAIRGALDREGETVALAAAVQLDQDPVDPGFEVDRMHVRRARPAMDVIDSGGAS